MFPSREAQPQAEPDLAPRTSDLFIEIEFCQKNRHGQDICGDFYRTQRFPEQDRVISVLSDGLGHGLKANILSTMTATMALKFTASDADLISSAETIMNALPVCRVRNISYATYTIVDIRMQTDISIVEMDNPPFLLIRNGAAVSVPCQEVESPALDGRKMKTYTLQAFPEDRLVVITDGISQSGIGTPDLKLGWRVEPVGKARARVWKYPGADEAAVQGALDRRRGYTVSDN